MDSLVVYLHTCNKRSARALDSCISLSLSTLTFKDGVQCMILLETMDSTDCLVSSCTFPCFSEKYHTISNIIF